MKYWSTLALLSWLLTYGSSHPSAPASYYLASAAIELGTTLEITTPLGTRVSVPFLSGTFVDHQNLTFASVLPGLGGENGILDSDGIFHADARITVSLSDASYGYLQITGSGQFGQSNTFQAVFETSSTTYGYLNDDFAWGNGSITGGYLYVDLFSTSAPP